MRTWVSQMPLAPCVEASEFHWIMMAPGAVPAVFEDEVGDLDGALVAALADLEDGLGTGFVGEEAPEAMMSGPDLASDFDVLISWDRDGLGDDVRAVIKVENLVVLDCVDGCLDGFRVIGSSVSLLRRGS